MAAVGADVWVLTETHRGLSPGTAYALAPGPPPHPTGRPPSAGRRFGVRAGLPALAVATRDGERAACVHLAEPSGRSVHVYGTVLPWLTDGRRGLLRGAAAFEAAVIEQERDW